MGAQGMWLHSPSPQPPTPATAVDWEGRRAGALQGQEGHPETSTESPDIMRPGKPRVSQGAEERASHDGCRGPSKAVAPKETAPTRQDGARKSGTSIM